MKEKMTLEQGFSRLEEITAEMEKGGVSLEKMFELYKEGMEIVKVCGEKIDTVEKEIIVLNKNENGEAYEL